MSSSGVTLVLSTTHTSVDPALMLRALERFNTNLSILEPNGEVSRAAAGGLKAKLGGAEITGAHQGDELEAHLRRHLCELIDADLEHLRSAHSIPPGDKRRWGKGSWPALSRGARRHEYPTLLAPFFDDAFLRTMKHNALCIVVPLAGLSLAMSGCSSSSTPTATNAAGSSTSGAPSAGGAASTSTDLCLTVPADKVSTLLGTPVKSAKVLTESGRFRVGNTLPGCTYQGDTIGVVQAEFLKCDDWKGLESDPIAKRKPLAAVGDSAMARPSGSDPTVLIDTISKKGDRCLYVQIFQGTTEAKAQSLTNEFLKD